MSKREEKKSWIVRLRCTVTKEVFTEPCTREQAETEPWEYAEDEQEIDQHDWDVTSVKENV